MSVQPVQSVQWDGIAILIATLVVTLTSSVTKVKKQATSPKLQPDNGAFGIWALIFLSLLLTGSLILANPSANSNHRDTESIDAENTESIADEKLALKMNRTAHYLLCASILFSTFWLLLQRKSYDKKNVPWDSIVLIISTILSALCVLFRSTEKNVQDVFVNIGPGLLCGWLLVASILTTIITHKRYTNETDLRTEWTIAIPYILLHTILSMYSSFSGKNTIAIAMAFTLLWTSAFSINDNATRVFGAVGAVELGAAIGPLIFKAVYP